MVNIFIFSVASKPSKGVRLSVAIKNLTLNFSFFLGFRTFKAQVPKGLSLVPFYITEWVPLIRNISAAKCLHLHHNQFGIRTSCCLIDIFTKTVLSFTACILYDTDLFKPFFTFNIVNYSSSKKFLGKMVLLCTLFACVNPPWTFLLFQLMLIPTKLAGDLSLSHFCGCFRKASFMPSHV